MKDRFDENIGKAIKESVENQTFVYNPEHWKQLLNKKKGSKKRAFIIWKWAAIIVLFLMAGTTANYFIKNNQVDPNEGLPAVEGIAKDSLKLDSIQLQDKKTLTTIDGDKKTSQEPEIKGSESQITSKPNKESIGNNDEANRIAELIKEEITSENSEKSVIKEDQKNNLDSDVSINKNLKLKENIAMNEVINRKDSLLLQKNEKSMISKQQIDSVLNSEKNLLAEELLAEDLPDEKEESIRKPVKFGLNIASIFNSKQANNSAYAGFSGGLSVEIPVSKNLEIYTGINYANENLSLNSNSQIPDNFVSAKGADILTSEEAVLKGIEIPLNMKYSFSISNKKFFVSAGFSSTKYFKEDIVASYLVSNRSAVETIDFNGNNIVQYELLQSNEEKISAPENSSFSFANILNLSIGMEIPFPNQKRSLILEPYFKYSLKPVTVQGVDYTRGGLRLRFLFNFQK